MTYVLVLTVWNAIAAVPGYASLAECQSAGERWKLEAKGSFTQYPGRYACIPGPALAR